MWTGRAALKILGIPQHIYDSKYSLLLCIYGFTFLYWTSAAFSLSLSYTEPVALFGRRISPSQGRYLHRTTQTQNKRIHRHLCLEKESNPRYQRSSERRQFMSLTARRLWSAIFFNYMSEQQQYKKTCRPLLHISATTDVIMRHGEHSKEILHSYKHRLSYGISTIRNLY
jgi:hypothetical protein